MTALRVFLYLVAAIGLTGGIGLCAAHLYTRVARRHLEHDLDRLNDWRRRG